MCKHDNIKLNVEYATDKCWLSVLCPRCKRYRTMSLTVNDSLLKELKKCVDLLKSALVEDCNK